MIHCPECLGPGPVIDSDPCSNGSMRRRHECKACGFRWTTHHGPPPGHRGGMPVGHRFTVKRFTPDEVRQVLLSTGSVRQIAAEFGRSRSAVHAVLIGRTHAHLFPELPRRKGQGQLSCLQCEHRRGKRCGMGHPDMELEGFSFANDCSTFLPRSA